MLTIYQILKQRMVIKAVRLNKDGKTIGEIIRLRTPFGKTFYFTKRWPQHYYIKGQGFAVDRGILKTLITDELNYHRKITGDPTLKIKVLLLYEGKRVRRLLIGEVEDFFLSEDMEYVKDRTIGLESYGVQKSLSESNFTLWKEEKVNNGGYK